jgi:hypothetical protein
MIPGMEWAKPEFPKNQVDRAGKILITESLDDARLEAALQIINNWRASHYYPLNTFKVTLRRKSQEVDRDRLVAQRIKRLSSIDLKLRRFSSMQLSQMQDIGGCRAIVGSLQQVEGLVKKYETSDLKHALNDKDDYVANPRTSGYRSVHLIYKYLSDKQAPSIYNGLSIEVQLRSRLQHAWATAVETVGTFLQQALKSSQGEERWLRFFALMGSALAVLRMYGRALNVSREGAQKRNHHFFLLRLEPAEERMTITGFPRKALEEASKLYLETERQISGSPGSEAVLVSVDSLAALERAYPNYFLDSDVFLQELQEAIKTR